MEVLSPEQLARELGLLKKRREAFEVSASQLTRDPQKEMTTVLLAWNGTANWSPRNSRRS